MKNFTFGQAVFLSVAAAFAVAFFAMSGAQADPDNLPQGVNINTLRPCNIEGATQQNVSVTATSARTSNVVAVGKIRVVCTQAAYMTSGVSAPTATTSHVFLPANLPETFYSPAVKYAFIRSSADGVCQVLECK